MLKDSVSLGIDSLSMVVTLQGGVISQLLWNQAQNKILFELKDSVSLGIGSLRMVVTIVIIQGAVVSTLLWNQALNKILFELNEKGTKVVVYANDVVFIIIGNVFSTISELMKTLLNDL